MAELHVQPKKNNFWWLWLLLAIIIIAGLIYYFNYYQKGKTLPLDATNDSTLNSYTEPVDTGVAPTANLWDQVDFDSPDTTYAEVVNKNITTKSNAHFAIYSIAVDHLFADGKSELSNEGKQNLNQVGASIHQRFNTGDIRIYAQSDTTRVDTLTSQRGKAVNDYLADNSGIDKSHISVFHPGEGTSVPDKKNTVNIVVKR
jgi:outer membrane protein OmpA-like peptidoglycan-associated protein